MKLAFPAFNNVLRRRDRSQTGPVPAGEYT
jgi:hypothetical protein